MRPQSTTNADKFWSKVDRSGGPDACWPRLGHPLTGDYAQCRRNGKNTLAHRVAYILTYGEPPEDKPHVLHRCDNRPCCNPAHLFPGTNADNMADKVAKSRQARGDRQGARLHPETVTRGDTHYSHTNPELVVRGVRCRTAKLDEEKVREIRARHAAGETFTELSRAFGVSRHPIRMIVLRRAWTHVP